MKGDGMIVAFLMLVFGFALVGIILEDYEKSFCRQRGIEFNKSAEEISRICK
jgi:hypothetical protein